MFSFFKKKYKAENAPETPEGIRKRPTNQTARRGSVEARALPHDNETNDKSSTLQKDVVNLLIPEIDYSQKTGVSALLQIMAGKKRRNRRKTRADSCRVSPPKETQMQRRNSDTTQPTPTPAQNTRVEPRSSNDPADFVKALVLQKYASKPETKQQHVSLVYVSNEPELDEKRHAEALLREIARSIDCDIDINDNKQMGNGDSKPNDPVYEPVADENIDNYKSDLKVELDRLLQDKDETKIDEKEDKAETESLDSPTNKKKSNLKIPKSDNEGCSDDDRSDCGKKRVTFRKHVIFDDGEQQTDDEMNSSFESLSSEEEENEYLEDALPDNDELLGGVLVTREDDNKTVISVTDDESIKIKVECFDDGLKRISSDNSDSGFIEISEKTDETEKEYAESGDSESESEEEIVEVIEEEIAESKDSRRVENETTNDEKTLVSQENKYQNQVDALTELAETRCQEAERARDLIVSYRKEIEAKDLEIEQLKSELAAAYKETELVRQKSRALEEEIIAARSLSASLADQLQRRNDESVRQLRSELEDAQTRRAELESKLLELEKERNRLEQEKEIEAQKAKEALSAAEASSSKWRVAHEAARSQAAARAEIILADCEWKMRELEKRARDAEKEKMELSQTVQALQNSSHKAELQQLRGLVGEQQHSLQSLSSRLQELQTREEELQMEVHRLEELLDREVRNGKVKTELHLQAVQNLKQEHTKELESLKAEHAASTSAMTARLAYERAAAERSRAALLQLKQEAEHQADRKLREVNVKLENLKKELAEKEAGYERALSEARSRADWDVLQLRHLLDKADIAYANNIEQMTEKFEKEKERLTEEWTEKLRVVEEQAAVAADEARRQLETTRSKMLAERYEQTSKLKEQHRIEMENQWEQFMSDKESCLSRMKSECRQEGEEERVQREKELMREIAELKSQIQSKSVEFENLEAKVAKCGRTLAVTEQELREALAREKEEREKRGEEAVRLQQVEKAAREQIEHLTRKCACLRKLFDDMRARLSTCEHNADQGARAREKEMQFLRAEVARLTKMLVEESSPKLGARTRADGCENSTKSDESFLTKASMTSEEENAPQRKGGTSQNGRRRAKS
ncbi:myosin-2 heavy chain, non muscle isoform X2 [Papilio machaon]|uniref:myosin-2 heavy chain, non muscle isoform X2 n=1 Tax=Papilio machaon TaxID=76193 RepID=UPI001E662E9A|nr:myosin-2 heavy chain, non muscle isoform X2 [Papilio machaon]